MSVLGRRIETIKSLNCTKKGSKNAFRTCSTPRGPISKKCKKPKKSKYMRTKCAYNAKNHAKMQKNPKHAENCRKCRKLQKMQIACILHLFCIAWRPGLACSFFAFSTEFHVLSIFDRISFYRAYLVCRCFDFFFASLILQTPKFQVPSPAPPCLN